MASITLIAINYAPEATGTAINNVDMAHRLRDAGHLVTVLTGMPHVPELRILEAYRGRVRDREILDEIRVVRLWNYVSTHQTALTRGIYEATFLMNGAVFAITPKPEVIIGVVPALSAAWLARLHARRGAVPFGLVFADLMGKAADQSGMPGGKVVAGLVQTVELGLARSADAIGVISDGFRDYLRLGGVESDRIVRLVNRNRAVTRRARWTRQQVRAQMGWPEEEVVIVHSGNMGYKQALENVIDAAALRPANGRLRFVLLGNGTRRAWLEKRASKLRLSNLQFLSPVPTENYDSLLAAADVLLVNQRGSVTDMSLPGKITNYFAAGVPVVAAVAPESEAAREVGRSGAGIVVSPDEPTELLKGIDQLIGDRTAYQEFARAGPRYARRHLAAASGSNITQLVDRLLSTAAHARPRP